MSITKTKVGQLNGADISLYTLDNGRGLSAEIYDFGGIIRSLKIAGRDVVLGRNTIEDYFQNDGYLGAAVGRNANRIKNAQFTLNGVEYKLAKNNGNNNLHGGNNGFSSKLWRGEIIDSAEPALALYLESADMEEGFPGNLSLCMTYTLTAENSLKINYSATTDADTVFNPTNHSYFNLDGHNSGKIYDHTMQINADFFTPGNEDCTPTGEIRTIHGTPFDFTSPKKLGEDINSDYKDIAMYGGFDHNFVPRGRGFRKVCSLTSSDSKLTMHTFTDMPGIMVYSANVLDEGSYKDGAKYGKHTAVCLETQFFPDNVNISHFPSSTLAKGEKFNSTTEYKFEQN